MTAAERLRAALLKEADRRAAMGHHAPAHDIRRAASDVVRAASMLDASKAVRS